MLQWVQSNVSLTDLQDMKLLKSNEYLADLHAVKFDFG